MSARGGVQRSGGGSSILHGFPKVPSNVLHPIELRRHLQSLRDALNEHRWLFGTLGDLTVAQQARLSKAFLQLATQTGLIIQLDQNLQQTQTDLSQAQTDLTAQQQDLQAQNTLLQQQDLTIQQLQAQVTLLNQSLQTANNQIGTLQTAITDIQNNCCP